MDNQFNLNGKNTLALARSESLQDHIDEFAGKYRGLMTRLCSKKMEPDDPEIIANYLEGSTDKNSAVAVVALLFLKYQSALTIIAPEDRERLYQTSAENLKRFLRVHIFDSANGLPLWEQKETADTIKNYLQGSKAYDEILPYINTYSTVSESIEYARCATYGGGTLGLDH